jgi:multidrug efflux pump subunit AcrA (membrane-fusion protein)
MAGYLMAGAFIASLAGAGVSAYSADQQGKANKRAAEAQAQQMKQQAKVNQQQAQVAQLQGEKESQRRMALLSQDIGSMYAGFAGNGIDLSSGTVGKALTTQANEAYNDVKTIEDNTRMNVWGLLSNAKQNINSAGISVFQGKSAKKAGSLSATGTAIGGVGNAIAAGSAGYDAGTKIENWWNS